MATNKQAFEKFADPYQKEEKEILVLTSDAESGAGKAQGDVLWTAHSYLLAYIDLATNELKEGEGRIVWPVTEKEEKDDVHFNRFKKGCIYRIKARELADKGVPEGSNASFYNQFMVVEVLDENVENNELLALLEEYRKPVIITDETLGEFQLDKDLGLFFGNINWLGENARVALDVDTGDEETWTKALDALKILFGQQQKWDAECREFAADKLVELANEWQQDEDEESGEITKTDFINRITLCELSVTSDGSFTAYYDDDDLFWGHVITVSGSIKKGLEDASIEG